MKSKIWKVMAVIFAVALIAPAFSAVESVKVGGDVTMYGVLRPDFNFQKIDETSANFFQTSVRVYVTADLTDNVQAMVRLINERAWGTLSEINWENIPSTQNNYTPLSGGTIDLDLAYIKVTDLLTPGLILTVGRQEIQFGEGLVVGSAYRAGMYPISNIATDLGLQKAFDAIRADYEVATVPVVITTFGAKVNDNSISPTTNRPVMDTNLYGLNVEYRPDLYSLDVYYVNANELHSDANLSTAGLRVSGNIPAVEGLSLKAEFAKQFGEDDSAPSKDFKGWAGLFGAKYQFNTNMSPYVKVNYNFFKGNSSASDYKGWVPVFPSDIASRVGKVAYPFLFSYGEGVINDTKGGFSALGANNLVGSGVKVVNVGFGLQPVEKLSLALDWFWLKGDETGSFDDEFGNEVDFSINYAYTEDLSFGLDVGYLAAGDFFSDLKKAHPDDYDDDNPWQVIASMKVAF